MQPITEFDHPDHGWKWTELELRWINERIAAEVAAEREACASLCEEVVTHPAGYGGQWEGYGLVKTQCDGLACAAAIRERSNAPELTRAKGVGVE